MDSSDEKYNGIYNEIDELLGEEILMKIYENYKGVQVNFPMRLYSKDYVIHYISNNYNGNNLKEIANKLGYSQRWVRRLIEVNKIERKE